MLKKEEANKPAQIRPPQGLRFHLTTASCRIAPSRPPSRDDDDVRHPEPPVRAEGTRFQHRHVSLSAFFYGDAVLNDN